MNEVLALLTRLILARLIGWAGVGLATFGVTTTQIHAGVAGVACVLLILIELITANVERD